MPLQVDPVGPGYLRRLRPDGRVADVLPRWDRLLADWAADAQMPLYVRKASGNRGRLLRHHSGRSVIPADNSVAHWAFALACAGECPTLDEVRRLITADQIPVAIILKTPEAKAATYRCTRRRVHGPNDAGWKLAHIDEIGIGARGDVTPMPLDVLIKHFKALVSPSNMFVVPMEWAGLAEVPEVVSAFRMTPSQVG